MKNIILYISLFSLICATTCVGEILKVPVLFAHYIEHKENNKDISFYTYIYQHYQDDDGDDNDNERDSQLPFKSGDAFTSQVVVAHSNLSTIKLRVPYCEHTDIQLTNYSEPGFKSPALSSIWQPPKFS